MLYLPKDVGGVLEVRAPARPDAPDATDTVEIRDAVGQRVAPVQWAFTEDVNTTVQGGGISAGATSITLAIGTNVARGRDYLLGPNADGEYEWVRCRKIAGAVLTPQYPTRFAHAAGVLFRQTYLRVTVTPAQAAAASVGWHAIWLWQLSDVRQEPLVVAFDITRLYIAHPPATLNDVQVRDPMVRTRVPGPTSDYPYDWDGVFDAALADVIRDVNSGLYAGGLLTDDDWKQLFILKVLYSYVGRIQGAELAPKTVELWRAEYLERLSLTKSQAKVDENQDGTFQVTERRAAGGRRYRA